MLLIVWHEYSIFDHIFNKDDSFFFWKKFNQETLEMVQHRAARFVNVGTEEQIV